MTKSVAILALPGVRMLDVAGPLDVFAEANVLAGRKHYELTLVAAAAGDIRASSGIRLRPDLLVANHGREQFDTLLVVAAPHADEDEPDPIAVEWLQRVIPATRRYGSVSSGAFLLAAAGLLDGKRVATHWAVAERLARDYPTILVEAEAIHLRDGKVRTAAGITAGLDLALALVEEDLGGIIASRISRQLVMFFRNPGGQSKLSRKGQAAPLGRSALQEVQRWAAGSPDADLRISVLAARAGLSARHFARLFHHEVGLTPARWVEQMRVAAARQLLETGRHAPKQVAARCGFAASDTFRRAFSRHVGVTPSEYRQCLNRSLESANTNLK